MLLTTGSGDVMVFTAYALEQPMVATDKVFTGSIPEIYQRYLVPLIFEPYALDLAQRVAKAKPRNVLETAAGTGVVTRAIASVLLSTARMVVTDLNQAMLGVAQSGLSHDARIEWRQADALALPFGDESFDIVVCQFGVMFFPDKLQGFKEAHRVLSPGGQFLFNVWGGIADNEFAEVVTDSLAQLFPQDPPRFLARTPHDYHDAEGICASLKSAGFTEVTVDEVECVSKCSSPRDPAVAYCQGTPLRNEIEARGLSRLEEATRHVTDALARRFGTGAIEGRTRALVFTAGR
jgi:ubiquinone/menaquinone biosynthesis C-methylase UbiE